MYTEIVHAMWSRGVGRHRVIILHFGLPAKWERYLRKESAKAQGKLLEPRQVKENVCNAWKWYLGKYGHF